MAIKRHDDLCEASHVQRDDRNQLLSLERHLVIENIVHLDSLNACNTVEMEEGSSCLFPTG